MANEPLTLSQLNRSLKRGFYDDARFLSKAGGSELILNSFTGSDISAHMVMPEPRNQNEMLASMDIDPSDYPWPSMKHFAELETISVSSARSVFPVRRIGEHHVHAYTRGSRTIAGTMVFTSFSRDVFAEMYRMHPGDQFTESGHHSAPPFHADQLAPFHVLLQGSNEYGVAANCALINVTLTNFGTTFSIHDLKVESTYTYVAQFFTPMVQDYNGFHDIVIRSQGMWDQPLSSIVEQSYNAEGQFMPI